MALSLTERLGVPLAATLVLVAFVLMAYVTQPVVVVVLICGLIALVLALSRPLIALRLAVALIPLELISLQLGAAALSPAEAMFALAGYGWLVRRVARREPIVVAAPLNRPFALLLVVSAAGLLVAEDAFTTAKLTVMWTGFALAYLLVVAEARPDQVRKLLMVVIAAAAVVAVIALVGLGGEAPELVEQGAVATGRATGSFAHPNVLSMFFVLALPLTIALAIAGVPGLRPWLALAACVMLAALAVSLSRGGLLAFVGSLVILLFWRPARRGAVLVAAVFVALTLAGANPVLGTPQFQVVTQRLESIRYTGAGTGDARTEIWKATPKIIADHPVLGVGAGNYPVVSRRYGLVSPGGDSFVHAHNLALTFGAERGLLGLLALAWGAAALTIILVQACVHSRGTSKSLAFGVATALTGFALKGVVDYELSTNVIAALFFLYAGCAVVVWRDTVPKSRVSPSGAR